MDRRSLSHSCREDDDGSMNRDDLADFLRKRRESLQPSDVGLVQGVRRRTAGLRREEVAVLCGMSTDYYTRLEQRRGPQPSDQMLLAITRGLRLTLDERDHLFFLAGQSPPRRLRPSEHVSPGLMRLFDRLEDTPALVLSDLAETLVQNRLSVALMGDDLRHRGLARSSFYRWFTDPGERLLYPERDRAHQSRLRAAALRAALGTGASAARGQEIVDALLGASPEFADLWSDYEVRNHFDDHKTLVHPELGEIEVDCQVLFTENQAQSLLVLTASAGSEGYEKLQLLSILAARQPTA